MGTDRCFWAALSILLLWAGAHLLLSSIQHPGEYADELILLGGTLSALGLVPLWVAVKQHLQAKALARHMRLSWDVSRENRVGEKGKGRTDRSHFQSKALQRPIEREQ